MKKINLLVTIFIFFTLSYGMNLWYKIGIIRDEYNITGNIIILSGLEFVLIIGLPIILIIINIIFLIVKNKSSIIRMALIVLSIGIIITSGFYTYKKNNKLVEYIQADQLQELTLSSLIEFYDKKESGIVYIKRDDCQQCIELDHFIDSQLKETNLVNV